MGEEVEEVTEATKDPGDLTYLAGKYLTFELDDEVYGLEICKVQEIIGLMDVTKVPKTPDFVRGVINLRGRVIPVIDVRLKFGLGPREATEKNCIIVLQIALAGAEMTTSIIVDAVSEVLEVEPEQIAPAPKFGTGLDTDFILAMGKVEHKVIMLLDADRVLSTRELEALQVETR